MADSADDEREEELSSIAAIFPELVLDPTNSFKASIDLTVAPQAPLAVTFPPAVDGAPPKSLPTPPTSDNEGPAPVGAPKPLAQDIHRLSYLPPLRLLVTLPDGYPADKPPQFDLSTSPKWLPDATLHKLVDEGPVLWEEYGRGQVVFAYIDFLQQAAERCFDLVGDEGAVIEVAEDMKIPLLDYDIKAKREKFAQETFDCGVCLEPKKGSVCYRLMRCGHVFCVACLQDFYTNCIKEGDVSSVRCLDPTCGKEDKKKKSERTISPGELLQIPIEQEMVKRYVEMKRKKKLEADKDTVYCPRKWCQGPARSKKYPKITDLTQLVESDSEGEEESGGPPRDRVEEQMRGSKSGDRLAVCEDCEYAFCRVCLGGWHGEFVRCYPRSSTELTEEEQASYDYLRLHTSQCPTCSSPCQKTHGCNHMCCFQCRTHFCYLCGAWLAPDNPYQHFNNKSLGCFMRLWELEEGDEGGNNNNDNNDRDVRFEGARGWEAAIAAVNEADAHAAQAVENVAAAPNPAAGDQNRAAALPPAPMPPRAENDPPLVVEMNQLRIAAPQGQQPQQPQRRAHPNRQNRNPNANQAARRNPLPVGGAEADGVAGRHVRFNRNNARMGRAQAGQQADDALQRFLAAAQADEEDGWDSDELDGDGDEAWIIPER